MNTKEKRYDIVNGPSKAVIFDACKYAYSVNFKVSMKLGVAFGYTQPKDHPGCAYFPMSITDVKIVGIQHEDGSGFSFNLEGYCKADLISPQRKKSTPNYQSYRFKAYYDAKNRTGWIQFFD